MKVAVIPIVNGALGTFTKGLIQGLKDYILIMYKFIIAISLFKI